MWRVRRDENYRAVALERQDRAKRWQTMLHLVPTERTENTVEMIVAKLNATERKAKDGNDEIGRH